MNIPATNPVGRPKSFKEEEVLLIVMDVFWQKGYESTSMNDLLKATGLHKGSIYQAFGDKHSLFILALRAYLENMRRTMTRLLGQAERGIEGLRAVFNHHIDLGERADGLHHGCMALNSLVETAQHDGEVMEVLKNAFQARMILITQAVVQAQAEGDLRADWEAQRITRLLMAGEAGIMAQLKGPLSEDLAKAMIDDLFEVLV